MYVRGRIWGPLAYFNQEVGTWVFIGWIIVGIIAGFIAEKVTDSNHGLLTNLVVGLIGAFVGGFIAGKFGIHFVNNAFSGYHDHCDTRRNSGAVCLSESSILIGLTAF